VSTSSLQDQINPKVLAFSLDLKFNSLLDKCVEGICDRVESLWDNHFRNSKQPVLNIAILVYQL
jgi:hypothetical protein